MKIGIITHWWSNDNYGQQMQLYALQRYLKQQGHEPFLIRYLHNSNTSKLKKLTMVLNPKLVFNFIYRKVNTAVYKLLNRNSPSREFEEFRTKYINQSEIIYRGYDSLLNNIPEADAYIVGSDQVWNFNIDAINAVTTRTDLKAWYLNFASKNAKKLSYAASFGRPYFPDNCLDYMKSLVEDFDYVSVREVTGIDICNKMGLQQSYLAPDPTLLLQKETYIKDFNLEINDNHDYALAYLLGSSIDLTIKDIKNEVTNMDIKYIASQNKVDLEDKTFATIPQWLELIANANFIITNSFHGVIFCIIFKKNFVAVPLTGTKKVMNVRLESLLGKLGLLQKIYNGNINDALSVNIDYNNVEEKLKNDPDFKLAIDMFKNTLGDK